MLGGVNITKSPSGGTMGLRVTHARRSCAARTLAVALALSFAGISQAQQHAGQYEQPDIDYGARIYRGHCITCHGERDDSIPGVSLGSNKFRRATSDRALTTIIRDGIAGTAMAPNSYSDSEL